MSRAAARLSIEKALALICRVTMSFFDPLLESRGISCAVGAKKNQLLFGTLSAAAHPSGVCF
jgi:hypothetical protein